MRAAVADGRRAHGLHSLGTSTAETPGAARRDAVRGGELLAPARESGSL
ncbi:hypothetical protein STTU_2156 [Streptomyces sp. Tu6071]|nr:hypothetical protein STTU_2156 [Streptomyces sp. Tu6071]